MKLYFNEIDEFASRWLAKLFPDATVDSRSIADVSHCDTENFRRCHFFGGIGGWELALQLAGWPHGREVWTGSCPCQPFSCAGKRKGESDERHLWPEFARLIGERKPATIFGEQVASKAGREWLAGIRADMEGMGYAVGSADLCAAGVAAPHIRQRLYWVADTSEKLGRCRRDESRRESEKRITDRRIIGGGLTGWPTPESLNQEIANLAGWCTPATRDWKDSPGMATTGINPDGSTRNRIDQLPRQAQLAFGLTSTPSNAETEKRGALNPAHSRWLMGFPPAWDDCAAMVTPLSRRSRRNS